MVPPMQRTVAEFVDYAKETMHSFGLTDKGWTLTLSTNARRRYGQCNYSTKEIQITEWHILYSNWNDVVDTLLHEIAHALVGPGHGHNIMWKAKCVEVGAKPNRCSNDKFTMPRKFIGKCTRCDLTIERDLRQPKLVHLTCLKALKADGATQSMAFEGSKFRWTRNAEAFTMAKSIKKARKTGKKVAVKKATKKKAKKAAPKPKSKKKVDLVAKYPHVISVDEARAPYKVEIKCTECGDSRWIKPQDAFQVKRCKGCQTGKSRASLDNLKRRKSKDATPTEAREEKMRRVEAKINSWVEKNERNMDFMNRKMKLIDDELDTALGTTSGKKQKKVWA